MVQTFLPYPNYKKCVRCLDDRRLNLQANHAVMILKTLVGIHEKEGKRGFPTHPITQFWRGYEPALAVYLVNCIQELKRRGKSVDKHQENAVKFKKLVERAVKLEQDGRLWRPMTDAQFHGDYKKLLIEKDPIFYGRKFDLMDEGLIG